MSTFSADNFESGTIAAAFGGTTSIIDFAMQKDKSILESLEEWKKKAILNLVHEGYLFRIQGKGTFVAGTTLRRENMRYYRYLTDFKSQEAAIKIHFLDLKKIKGICLINQFLKIRQKQGLFELRRFFTSNGKPIIYTVSYLPQKLFPDLENFPRTRFERIPIFISLEESYGLPTIFNRELIGVETPDARVAEALRSHVRLN